MANRYILAFYDESNNMRLFPEVLHVSPGDNVIWASNLDDPYIAGDFSSTHLFPDPDYAMPANNQSSPAQVKPHAPINTPLLICTHARWWYGDQRWGTAVLEAGSSSLTLRERAMVMGIAKREVQARKQAGNNQ